MRPSSISVATDSTVSCSRTFSRPVSGGERRAALEERRARARTRPSARRARPSIQNAGSRVASCSGLSRSSAAAAGSIASGALRRPRRRRAAPPASAAASNTGSPIARASSRASDACPLASRRSQLISEVSASARRRRMRSGDGLRGQRAERHVEPLPRVLGPPQPPLRVGDGDDEAQPILGRRPCRARRAASRGPPAASPAAACASASRACDRGARVRAIGQQPQRGGVEARRRRRRGRLQLAGGGARAARSPRSSPRPAACSTWWARSTGPAPRCPSAAAARA